MPLELAALVESGADGSLNALAKLVSTASNAQEGIFDPGSLIQPLLQLRSELKAAGNYQLTDQLREIIFTLQEKIEDLPTGSNWSIN